LDALSELIFVDPGAKIHRHPELVNDSVTGMFCCKNFCLVIRRVSGNMFTFQQDSAPAHRAWDMIELLRRSTPDFIAPNSPDLNPVDYAMVSHAAVCVSDQSP